jgi:hypothetical protein
MTDQLPDLEKTKVNLETSRISWLELQRFFAAGLAIAVEQNLDLVDVAYQFSLDNKPLVEAWLNTGSIGPVSDQQAKTWYENRTEVWAVVVKPWVLVQGAANRAG